MNIKSAAILRVGILSAALALSACHSSSTGAVDGPGIGGASAGGTVGSPSTGGTIGGAGTGGTVGDPSSGNPGPGSTVGNPGSSGTAGAPGSGGTAGTPGSGGTVGAPGSGGGSPSPSCASTPGLPVIGSSCPAKRVLTWGYDGDGLTGETDGTDKLQSSKGSWTNAASRAHVNQWLSFAEGNPKAQADCQPAGNCIPVFYQDPSIQYVPSLTSTPTPKPYCGGSNDDFYEQVQSGHEDWILHVPGATKPYRPADRKVFFAPHSICGGKAPAGSGLEAFYPNRAIQGVRDWFVNLANQWPGFWIMNDDLDPVSSWHIAQPYATEFSNGHVYAAAIGQMLDAYGAAGHNVVGNGLSYNGPRAKENSYYGVYGDPSEFFRDNTRHNLWGMLHEKPLDVNVNPPWTMNVYRELNTQSLLLDGSTPHGYIMLDQRDPTPNRRIHDAVFWLGFRDGYSVNFDYFTAGDPTKLPAHPEVTLYPYDPVQTMRPISIGMTDTVQYNASGCKYSSAAGATFDDSFHGGSRDLVVACGTTSVGGAKLPMGVYRREFRQCYDYGVPFGPCAVILNDTDQAMTVAGSWLTQRYGHLIQWTPEDVLTAGCNDKTGCPKSALNLAAAPFVEGSTKIPAHDAIFLSP